MCGVVNEGYVSGSQSCAQLRFSRLGGFLMGGREAEHKISEWESAWECVQSERAS